MGFILTSMKLTKLYFPLVSLIQQLISRDSECSIEANSEKKMRVMIG